MAAYSKEEVCWSKYSESRHRCSLSADSLKTVSKLCSSYQYCALLKFAKQKAAEDFPAFSSVYASICRFAGHHSSSHHHRFSLAGEWCSWSQSLSSLFSVYSYWILGCLWSEKPTTASHFPTWQRLSCFVLTTPTLEISLCSTLYLFESVT